jgi:hypothetical protein
MPTSAEAMSEPHDQPTLRIRNILGSPRRCAIPLRIEGMLQLIRGMQETS